MAEYKLANGDVLTDEDIDRICKEFESESWAGRLERIHRGPAAVANEPLVTVPVKFPRSIVVSIDGRAKNHSDFIREVGVAALEISPLHRLLGAVRGASACGKPYSRLLRFDRTGKYRYRTGYARQFH